MMNEKLNAAIVDVLNELCEFSNEIRTSKWDVFKLARKRSGEFVRYRDVKSEIGEIMDQYIEEHDYSCVKSFITSSKGEVYTEYVIITEEDEILDEDSSCMQLNVKSRGRVTIPAEKVREAGFEIGKNITVTKMLDNESNSDIMYFIGNTSIPDEVFDDMSVIDVYSVTVDKDSNIRLTVGNDIMNPHLQIEDGCLIIF